ncbi:hypothetical protein SBI_01480 [Streptomyces bingchenggensis BCW-1]|uniref:Uncharacterized protein n=1 Tax=Streptomyces bingchenggensis (strain BCW-1) TaxID=749414 RepID=D7CDT6_STRBB|nr:hypothetical protein SBI_01480 [Streptomyces bingchenggensis BCW-1]
MRGFSVNRGPDQGAGGIAVHGQLRQAGERPCVVGDLAGLADVDDGGEGFNHGVLVVVEVEGLHTNEPMTALPGSELHTARGQTPMHPGPSAAP